MWVVLAGAGERCAKELVVLEEVLARAEVELLFAVLLPPLGLGLDGAILVVAAWGGLGVLFLGVVAVDFVDVGHALGGGGARPKE